MIFNFQAMRAFAAFLVTLVHIEVFLAGSSVPPQYLSFGHVGVDIFFVLSGFVIAHSALSRAPTAGEFVTHRVLRVVPIYWLLTFGIFAIAVVVPGLLGATVANPIDLLKSLFFIPYQKLNGLVQPVLFIGWTLNYEMFFYLVFALFLWAFRRKVSLAIAGTSVALLALVIVVQYTRPPSLELRFYGYPIILEFVFGMWLAMAARRWPGTDGGMIALPLFSASAGVLFAYHFVWPEGPRWLLGGVPAAGLLWSVLLLERCGRVLDGKTVQLLGAASYALYLSHPFVLQGIGKVLEKVAPSTLGVFSAAGAIVIAHGVGVGIHLLVERPMTLKLKAILAGQPPRAVTASGKARTHG